MALGVGELDHREHVQQTTTGGLGGIIKKLLERIVNLGPRRRRVGGRVSAGDGEVSDLISFLE